MSTQGRTFADRYSLDVQIPASVGTPVWRALDMVLKRWVTVYLMPRSDVRSVAVIAACQKAAAATPRAAVSIIDVVEQGTIRGISTISPAEEFLGVITEWTEGETLDRRLLRRAEPMDSASAINVSRTIAGVIKQAHDKGLSHGRLRPHNIVFDDTDAIRITGFGVESSFLGNDRTSGIQADVQGLGNLLFAMVTGQWPDSQVDGLPAASTVGAIPQPSSVASPVAPLVDAVFLGTQDGSILSVDDVLNRLAEPMAVTQTPAAQTDATDDEIPGLALVDDDESAAPQEQADDSTNVTNTEGEVQGQEAIEADAPESTAVLDPADTGAPPAAAEPSPWSQSGTRHVAAEPWRPLIPDAADVPKPAAKASRMSALRAKARPTTSAPSAGKAALARAQRTLTKAGSWLASLPSRIGSDSIGSGSIGPSGVGASATGGASTMGAGNTATAVAHATAAAAKPRSPRFANPIPAPLATPDTSAWQPEPPNARLRAILVAFISVLLFGWLGWRMLTVSVGGDTFVAPSPSPSASTSPSASASPSNTTPAKLATIAGAKVWDPFGDGAENSAKVPRAVDGNPKTAWQTTVYDKPIGETQAGVGIVVDLGATASVSSVSVSFGTAGAAVSAYVTNDGTPKLKQSLLLGSVSGAGTEATLSGARPLAGRYVVVWLTDLPKSADGGYQASIYEVTVTLA